VLVKVDVGFHRCGIDPDRGAAEFIQAVAGMKGLRVRGLLSHAGQAYRASSEDELRSIADVEAEVLIALKARAAESGVLLHEISVGATPTLRFSATARGVTELRPGNYVYFDRTQVTLGSASLDDCALTVLATVVSKPAADRIILDCGSKTLSSDLAPYVTGYGVVLTRDGSAIDGSLSIERLSEEHATVSVRRHPARAWRSGPRAPQSFVRGVESGRRCPTGRRRSCRRHVTRGCPGKDTIDRRDRRDRRVLFGI